MSFAPLLALSLTFSFAFSFGNPGGALAGPRLSIAATAWAPARGSVEVDTSAVGEEGPAIQRRLESRAGDILLDNEVLPAKDPADACFEVRIRPAGADEPGWLATIELRRGGDPIDDATREIDCKLCTEGELVDKVAAALQELIPMHAIAPEPAGEDPAAGDPVEPRPTKPQKDGKLGRMGYAGIGIAALGVVGIGVGAGLLAKKPVLLKDDASQQKTFTAPGAATLAIGAAALVTGVALIVVDQVRGKKSKQTAVLPWANPAGGGVALAGRF